MIFLTDLNPLQIENLVAYTIGNLPAAVGSRLLQ